MKYKTHDGSINYTIDDKPFRISYMNYDPSIYETELNTKINYVRSLFDTYPHISSLDDMNIIRSPISHYRNRCRFGILHTQSEESIKLDYTMWDEGVATIKVITFPIAVKSIANLMQPLIQFVETINELYNDLRSIYFQSTINNQVMITLCYQRPLPLQLWEEHATCLRNHLLSLNLSCISDINIIGRSKGVKIVIGKDNLLDTIQLQNGQLLHYNQVDDGFCNPNAVVNIEVLNWVCSTIEYCNQSYERRYHIDNNKCVINPLEIHANNINVIGDDNNNNYNMKDNNNDNNSSTNRSSGNRSRSSDSKEDNTNINKIRRKMNLLELFCGNGNHTNAIARYCHHIVAVEINKSLCMAAEYNLKMNDINNVTVIICDSQKFTYKILKNKYYEINIPMSSSCQSDKQQHMGDVSTCQQTIDNSGHPYILSTSTSTPISTISSLVTGTAATTTTTTTPTNISTTTTTATATSASSLSLSTCISNQRIEFDIVLVDPPRCGLDKNTKKLIGTYDYIVYISCNPAALQQDIEHMKETHMIAKFGLFDQFAYTPHIECGVLLQKKTLDVLS